MKRYDLFKAHVPTEDALLNLKEVLSSGYMNEGVQVSRLASGVQEKLSANNLVLTNSCTSALTVALHMCGKGEVITTPMTCVATNAPIQHVGSRIVWADVDPATGTIDPLSVKDRITSCTRAVIAVAWAGTPPELLDLSQLCKAYGINLILDAAHAFGATYKGLPVHCWADMTAYSFQAIKHFTTGDGGALVCIDDDDHAWARALKWFGLDRDKAKDDRGDWKGQQWDVDIEDIGFKFNMNNVSAAIGLANLKYIDSVLLKHRQNAALYDELFKDFASVVPVRRPEGSTSSHWVYTVKVVPEKSAMQRNELLRVLNEEGIMAGLVHVPNDTYTCFRYSAVDLPGVREFSARQFSLPCGWWLEPEDIEHITRRVKELTT